MEARRLKFRVVDFGVLAVLLMASALAASGCRCPSCNFNSVAENCKCCIFRQIGKRGDPNSDLDTRSAVNRNLPNHHSSIARDLFALDSDWSDHMDDSDTSSLYVRYLNDARR